jgi:hypothetical protein
MIEGSIDFNYKVTYLNRIELQVVNGQTAYQCIVYKWVQAILINKRINYLDPRVVSLYRVGYLGTSL